MTSTAPADHAATDRLPHGARVLMIRLSALGDIIFALEAVSTLKAQRPDVRIDFLVEDRFAATLHGHPQIERLIVVPRRQPWRLPGHLWRLRRTRYDALLDLHGILKSGLQVLCARARHKIGYAAPVSREGAAIVYHHRVALADPQQHRADCGLALLRELGLRGAPQPAVLPTPDTDLDVFGDRPGPRVLLHPGTSAFAAFKRWPIDRFAALAVRLTDAGVPVAVSFGPGEADLLAAIRGAAPAVIPVDGRQLGLGGLVAALRQADVVVAADTGPLHMAAAVGTRVVALFGPKDTRRYGPRGAGHAVLFHQVPCRPCRLRTCASPQCVLGIAVEEVVERVLEPVGA